MIRRCLPVISALFALLLLQAGVLEAADRNVRIGISPNVASGTLLGSGLTARDASGKSFKISGGKVKAAGGYVQIGSAKLRMPVRVQGPALGWEKIRYRGSLSFIQAAKGFTVVNELDLESYIRGILKIEMNPEWPQEALKAQAILARTYAVRNAGRFAAQGFDLDATENSQMYRGMNAEDPRTDAAVSATAGRVLTYNGQVATVYYHSDSGGATADVSHVWGGSVPYLTARAEPVMYQSPYSVWSVSLSPRDVASALGKIKVDVGNVRGVRVKQKDSSGRAVLLGVTGDRGEADVRAHAFRMAIGSRVLRSTYFDIVGEGSAVRAPAAAVNNKPASPPPVARAPFAAEMASEEDPLVEMTRNGVFTKEEMMDMLMNPDKRDDYLRRGLARVGGDTKKAMPLPVPAVKQPQVNEPAVTPQTASPMGLTFSGRGWGHGVGLSQWGAKAMAENGASCEAILTHYFPGTKIGR